MRAKQPIRCRKRSLAGPLAAAGLAFAAAVASGDAQAASPDVRIIVVTPAVEGGEADVRALQEAIGSGAERANATVDASGPTTCSDAGCWAAVARDGDSSYVLDSRVKVVDRDYTLELRLRGPTGDVVAETSRTCDICGFDEVLDLAAAEAALVVGAAGDDGAKPVLVVRSNIPGGHVFIDGERVGATPYEAPATPGKHVVRVEADGYTAVEQDVNLVEGVRSEAQFELTKMPASNNKLRTAGWALTGTGIAMLAGGITLLALDHSEYGKQCDGTDVDAQGDCRYLIETKWPGAALAIAGAAATSVGVAFVVMHRKGRRTGVRASVGPGRVMLQGRF